MGSIDIARLHFRCRLQRGGEVARAWMSRIDAIRSNLVDSHLEPALAPFAMTDGVICVRRIALPLRLSGALTDWQSSLQWSALIAAELQRILARNAPDEVLLFPHELAARRAFLADALAGRSERDWAWRQLAWLPASDPASDGARLEAAIAWLLTASENVVPALRSLAAVGLLPALARSLDRVRRDRLLIAALAAVPDAAPALARWVVDGTPERPDLPSRPMPPRAAGAIAAAFRVVLASAADPEERRIWAVLGVLAVESQRLRATPEAAVAAAAAWVQEIAAPTLPAAAPSPNRRALAQPRPSARSEADSADRHAAPGEAEPPAPVPQRADRQTSVTSIRADDAAECPAAPVAAGPVEGETAFGGLLFLLPLVAETGALDRLLAAPALANWPLAAILHRLALTLLPPLRVVDPAVLAFAGLLPDAVPPDASEPGDWRRAPAAPPTAALDEAGTLVVDELTARLPQWAGPALVQRVAERPAVIAADPGWIEVRLRLADVSVDLRRATLDLDPGFLPWLGIVLRFSYA